MKLIFLIGAGAVGKMTVGQELAKITPLRLFHNHMAIEPVVEIFGTFHREAVTSIRDVIFKEFAATDNYGMIFTFMMDFDVQENWDYLAHVRSFFEPYGTEFYYVELIAPQEVRLARNHTENRLRHKPTKRNLALSDCRLMSEDAGHRLVSREGEIPFENYLRLENADLSAAEAAEIIKQRFDL